MAERAISSIVNLDSIHPATKSEDYKDISQALKVSNNCKLPAFPDASKDAYTIPALPTVMCPIAQPVVPIIPPPYIPNALSGVCPTGYDFSFDQTIECTGVAVAADGTSAGRSYQKVTLANPNPSLTQVFLGSDEKNIHCLLELRKSYTTAILLDPVSLIADKVYTAVTACTIKRPGTTDLQLATGSQTRAGTGWLLTAGQILESTKCPIDHGYAGSPAGEIRVDVTDGGFELGSNIYTTKLYIRRFEVTQRGDLPAGASLVSGLMDNACHVWVGGGINLPPVCPNGTSMRSYVRPSWKGAVDLCSLTVTSGQPADTTIEFTNGCTGTMPNSMFDTIGGEYPQLELQAKDHIETPVLNVAYKVIADTATPEGTVTYGGVTYADNQTFYGSTGTVTNNGAKAFKVGYLDIQSKPDNNNKFSASIVTGQTGFVSYNDLSDFMTTQIIGNGKFGINYMRFSLSNLPSSMGIRPEATDSCQNLFGANFRLPPTFAGNKCSEITINGKPGSGCAFDISSLMPPVDVHQGAGNYLALGWVGTAQGSVLGLRAGNRDNNVEPAKNRLSDANPNTRYKGGNVVAYTDGTSKVNYLKPVIFLEGASKKIEDDTQTDTLLDENGAVIGTRLVITGDKEKTGDTAADVANDLKAGDTNELEHALKALVWNNVSGKPAKPADGQPKPDGYDSFKGVAVGSATTADLANIALRKYEYCKAGVTYHVLLVGSPLYAVNTDGTTDWNKAHMVNPV